MPILYALIRHSSTVLCEVTAEGVEGDFSALTRLLLRRLPAAPPSPCTFLLPLLSRRCTPRTRRTCTISSCSTTCTSTTSSRCASQTAPSPARSPSPSSLSSTPLSSRRPHCLRLSRSSSRRHRCRHRLRRRSPRHCSLRRRRPPPSPPPPSFHALYQPSLSSLISHFNALSLPPPPDTVVAQSMVHSIDRVVERGQPIEVLVQKVETMEARGIRFDRLPGAPRDGAGRTAREEGTLGEERAHRSRAVRVRGSYRVQ